MPIKEAILEACSLRLRPILMTTLSTMLGMTPVALGIGAGAELRQSMGVVLIGGLTTSTLLTLVVVPLIYMLTEEYKEKGWQRKLRNNGPCRNGVHSVRQMLRCVPRCVVMCKVLLSKVLDFP